MWPYGQLQAAVVHSPPRIWCRASFLVAHVWSCFRLTQQTLDEHASRGTATNILGCTSWEVSQLSKTRRVCRRGQSRTPGNLVYFIVDLPRNRAKKPTSVASIFRMPAPTAPKFCSHRQASMNSQIRKNGEDRRRSTWVQLSPTLPLLLWFACLSIQETWHMERGGEGGVSRFWRGASFVVQ